MYILVLGMHETVRILLESITMSPSVVLVTSPAKCKSVLMRPQLKFRHDVSLPQCQRCQYRPSAYRLQKSHPALQMNLQYAYTGILQSAMLAGGLSMTN